MDAVPSVWAIAVVELHATRALDGVKVERLELRDEAGAVIARATLPAEARVIPERDAAPLTRESTRPFSGRVGAAETARLWIYVALDVPMAKMGAPKRYRVELGTSEGARLEAEGDVAGPWPTG